MKFDKKITNRSEAKEFIKDLVLNDLDFLLIHARRNL